eukprot:CAMPEP_0182427938 /NCGR_PEP_ID=MMETSP1167-20130531/20902_1 /TAXON_ID=2988 /ORGANISM="Mallomonas Sp, Strain CCMP3275" /LENGTH=455 /DNA_ID=CAMNT_0024610541 /DNA_START=288 /DNA_END=1656 /DNA_ORIENTATION=+
MAAYGINSKFEAYKRSYGNMVANTIFLVCALFIVGLSISQPEGTAPIAQFADVFDPSGNPLQAMMGMMSYKNFVSEEWSHVLTWDLLVGRLIWMDGLQSGIFTSHSVLLTNLIGPPGLLLHFATCLLLKKELAFSSSVSSSSSSTSLFSSSSLPFLSRADEILTTCVPLMLTESGAHWLADKCSEEVNWEETNTIGTCQGRESVRNMLITRAKKHSNAFSLSRSLSLSRRVVTRVTEGKERAGASWVLQDAQGRQGLRGLIYLETSLQGEIIYVREVAEPLYKPGSLTSVLLKNVAKQALDKNPKLWHPPSPVSPRQPSSAEEIVQYLWLEVNGGDVEQVLAVFNDSIEYTDFNFPNPFIGKKAVREFLKEFDVPGIIFKAERISEGKDACCFTWSVTLVGQTQSTRGISLYETTPDGRLIIRVCDIAEPLIKPAPLQELAALLNPSLRRFRPLP